jgi:hypothetical protein
MLVLIQNAIALKMLQVEWYVLYFITDLKQYYNVIRKLIILQHRQQYPLEVILLPLSTIIFSSGKTFPDL